MCVPLTITAHNKCICRGWSHMKKYDPTGRNTEEGSRVKEQSVFLYPSQRNVSSGQRDVWDDGLVSDYLCFTWAYTPDKNYQSRAYLLWYVCMYRVRQQLGRLTASLYYKSMHLLWHVSRMRMHTCYVSRKCDPVCRNMHTSFKCIHGLFFG